jgi:N6-L-threonylcarbamoyladenine synthase
MPGLDFSFSGIKTAFLYFLRDKKKNNPAFVEENLYDLCASIQHHLVTMLLDKLEQAVQQTGIKEVGIAGGVSANSYLRQQLAARALRNGWNTYIPAFEYCTDNAAMIAMAAHYKYQQGLFTSLEATPLARYPINRTLP